MILPDHSCGSENSCVILNLHLSLSFFPKALDAMRKAHEMEVQKEIAKFKAEFIKKMQATHDIGALHKEHEYVPFNYGCRTHCLSF